MVNIVNTIHRLINIEALRIFRYVDIRRYWGSKFCDKILCKCGYKHKFFWIETISAAVLHGPLTRYLKSRDVHTPGMPGTFYPPPRVSDVDIHHGTRVTHVSWSMVGSLTSGFGDGENVSGIPGTCAARKFTYLVRGRMASGGPTGVDSYISGILTISTSWPFAMVWICYRKYIQRTYGKSTHPFYMLCCENDRLYPYALRSLLLNKLTHPCFLAVVW